MATRKTKRGFKPNVTVRWEGGSNYSVSTPNGVRRVSASGLGAAVQAAAKGWRTYYETKNG